MLQHKWSIHSALVASAACRSCAHSVPVEYVLLYVHNVMTSLFEVGCNLRLVLWEHLSIMYQRGITLCQRLQPLILQHF